MASLSRHGIVQGRGAREQQDLLSQLASRFGLNRLAAHWGGGTYLDVTFDDPITAARLDVDESGFGSQQALPVLTDLMDAERGSVVMVEEIEHSCHPEWVAAWGETLA